MSEKKNIVLSIIMPVYNMEHSLERTLEYFVVEGYEFLEETELIIINDCSNDNTANIIGKYCSRIPNLTILHRVERLGTGKARNEGLQAAKGEFVGFMDGDDLFNLDVAFALIEEMNKWGVALGISTFDKWDSSTREYTEYYKGLNFLSKPIPEQWLEQFCFLDDEARDSYNKFKLVNAACWNKIFRLSFIKEKGIHFSETNYAEDMSFTYQVLGFVRDFVYCTRSMYVYTDYKTNEKSNCRTFNWIELFTAFDDVIDVIDENIPYMLGDFVVAVLSHIEFARRILTNPKEELSKFNDFAMDWLISLYKKYGGV